MRNKVRGVFDFRLLDTFVLRNNLEESTKPARVWWGVSSAQTVIDNSTSQLGVVGLHSFTHLRWGGGDLAGSAYATSM